MEDNYTVDKETRRWTGLVIAGIIVAVFAFVLYHDKSPIAAQVTGIVLQKVVDTFINWPYIVASLVVGYVFALHRHGLIKK
jgi:uncharacterized membrane protein YdfJ with MMPL/SSD domain